jgi:hypothetical protein
MKNLTPNFIRSSAWVLSALALVTLADYLWDGFHDSKWWTIGYISSLAIPFVIFPVVVWFMFVPKRMAYSDEEIVIQRWFTPGCKLPWSTLDYYGTGENVFVLQFAGRQSFQIFASAFPRGEWRVFSAFLKKRYPEKRASGNIAGKLFKWGK